MNPCQAHSIQTQHNNRFNLNNTNTDLEIFLESPDQIDDILAYAEQSQTWMTLRERAKDNRHHQRQVM